VTIDWGTDVGKVKEVLEFDGGKFLGLLYLQQSGKHKKKKTEVN